MGISRPMPKAQNSPQNSGAYKIRELWERADLGEIRTFDVTLPPHGAILLALEPRQDRKGAAGGWGFHKAPPKPKKGRSDTPCLINRH
jgi:hypothetical protein